MAGLIAEERRRYHERLCRERVLAWRPDQKGQKVATIADSDNRKSIEVAQTLAEEICRELGLDDLWETPSSGQTLGTQFTKITRDYLQECFDALGAVRPGPWRYWTDQPGEGIARYEQYTHLHDLAELARKYPELSTALGHDYIIKPDIVISREPLDDETINREASRPVVEGQDRVGLHTSLRRASAYHHGGGPYQIMHASISCKWTMRSDRAQNTRTEALNLIRNRKGRTPAIVAVTAEPLPSRIASLALGTGDIDRVYHFALPELVRAVEGVGGDDTVEQLHQLIDQKRLADISDLPFDLAI